MKPEKLIQQIIPAENWWACYDFKEEGDESPEGVVVDRLVCWTLVSEGESQSIEGMTEAGGYIGTVEDVRSFKGYVYALSEQEAIKADAVAVR